MVGSVAVMVLRFINIFYYITYHVDFFIIMQRFLKYRFN